MIDYLQSGDAPGAAAMNALFQELERKMALVLSGKSPLAWPAVRSVLVDGSPAFGKVFPFFTDTSPSNRVFTDGMTTYAHSTFVSAVNAATVNGTDADRGLVFIDDPGVDLDDSIAAHRRVVGGDNLWVAIGTEDAFLRPEKIHRYAVAEIILENFTSLWLPRSYNKYNHFRLHNGNLSPATVTFEGGPSYTIDPLGCVSVRRTAWDGDYHQGTYFFPVLAGDPRFYNAGTNATQFPERSWTANNVCNPAIAFLWLSLLEASDRQSCGWEFDRRVTHDLSSDYASLFGDIGSGETRLGDLRIHKGALRVASGMPGPAEFVSLTWSGVDQALSFGRDVLSAEWDDATDDLTISKADGADADVIATGTDLLRNAGAHRVIATLPVTVPGAVSLTPGERGNSVRVPPDSTTEELSNSYVALNGSLQVVSGDRSKVAGLGDLKTLNYWLRTRCLDLEDDLSEVGTVEEAWLSVYGPAWRLQQVVDTSVPGYSVPMWWRLDASGEIVEDVVVVMDETGWPALDWWPLPYAVTYATPLFQTPRHRRYMLDVSGGYREYRSPDSDATETRGNGEDAVFRKGQQYRCEAKVLTPPDLVRQVMGEQWSQAIGAEYRHPMADYYLPPDNLDDIIRFGLSDGSWYSANRETLLEGQAWEIDATGWVRFKFAARGLRPQLLKEHFNHIAWLVNCIQAVRPLRLVDVAFRVGGTLGTLATRGANTNGLTTAAGANTTIRPRNQYGRTTAGDWTEQLAARLGVPVRTAADLPGDLATARAAWVGARYQRWSFDRQNTVTREGALLGADLTPPNPIWPTRWFYAVDVTTQVSDTPRYLGLEYGVADVDVNVFSDMTYRWVSQVDLMAAADGLGLAWWGSRLVRPLRIEVMNASAPTLPSWSRPQGPVTNQTWYGGSFNSGYDTQAGAEAFAVSAGLKRTVGEQWVEEIVFLQPDVFIRWLEDAGADAEWVADPGWRVSTLDQDGIGRASVLTTGQWQARDPGLWELSLGDFTTLRVRRGVPEDALVADAGEVRGFAVLAWLSDGIVEGGVAVLTPSFAWVRQAEFSSVGLSESRHFASYGDRGRPVTLLEPDPANAYLWECTEDATLLDPAEVPELVAGGIEAAYEVAWLPNEYLNAEDDAE